MLLLFAGCDIGELMRTVLLVAATALVMATSTQAGEPINLSGRWSGHWESLSNGHRGPLHATFTKADDSHYSVIFRGRFLKILPFRYTSKLEVTGYEDDRVLLAGSRRLLFFGTFSYRAEATCSDFTATYEARNDHGVFIMKR
jgi:hypothetical protein